MLIHAKTRLMASRPLTLDQWKAEVKKNHPKVKFIVEDGTGNTYGEKGDWIALTGPDTQADVVGTFSLPADCCWLTNTKTKDQDEYGVSASTENPMNDGVAFETLIDGDPRNMKPLVQELTENDGGIEPADENLLLQDDIQYRH